MGWQIRGERWQRRTDSAAASGSLPASPGAGSGAGANAAALSGGGAAVPGWLLTTANTGIAKHGLTDADMTTLTIPTWGGIPGSANIGPGASVSGAPQAATYTRRIINVGGNVVAPASGTTFNQCVIVGSYAPVNIAGSNVSFIDCDIRTNSTGTGGETSINAHPYFGAGTGLLVRGCKITGGTLFVNWTSVQGIIEDSYGYGQDPETGGGQHRDGFTCRGGGAGIIVRRNRFDTNQNSTTGAFFLQDTYGDGVDGVVAQDNLFEGAGYCVTLDRTTNLTFTNNRLRSYSAYALGTHVSASSTFTAWSGNYVYSTTPPDYQGTLIPQP